MTKTPGQIAYEADCAAKPCYHDGKPRAAWDKIGAMGKASWEKNPTPRWQACKTELTPIGEQYVMPGCEKHVRPVGSQLKLWEA